MNNNEQIHTKSEANNNLSLKNAFNEMNITQNNIENDKKTTTEVITTNNITQINLNNNTNIENLSGEVKQLKIKIEHQFQTKSKQ